VDIRAICQVRAMVEAHKEFSRKKREGRVYPQIFTDSRRFKKSSDERSVEICENLWMKRFGHN
jgi:hypothetical protein